MIVITNNNAINMHYAQNKLKYMLYPCEYIYNNAQNTYGVANCATQNIYSIECLYSNC